MAEGRWIRIAMATGIAAILVSQVFLIVRVQSFIHRVEPLVERVESLEDDFQDREMEVALPDASQAVPLTVAPTELFINIDAQGQYLVNGAVLDLNGLEDIVVRAAATSPDLSVIVRAHQDVPVDVVVTAINVCKRAGIQSYIMNTDGQGG